LPSHQCITTVEQSSRESKRFDLSGNEKILEGEKKGKWVEVMPMAVWSHNTTVCQATNFTLFQLMYMAEAMLLEETKHQSLWVTTENTVCPSEAEEKDLLKPDRLKAVSNL
jgi:hypothetical protein